MNSPAQPQESKPQADTSTTLGAARKLPKSFRRWLRRLVIIIAVTIVAAYIAICAVMFVNQRRLIYYPRAAYNRTPADVGLSYEDVTLTTDDGVTLAAWYVPCEPARATVLHCHGNAENISHICSSVQALHQLGCSVLVLDYRGYGRSTGKPTEDGLYRDAEAAWRYLTEVRGVPPKRIVLMGRSLGGAVVIDLATRHTPGALVVECTFPSVVDIARRLYPYLPVGLLCRDRFDSLKKVPQVRCPKLFFHGTYDGLVPLEDARRLFAAAPEPKHFIETPGHHNSAGFEYSEDYERQFGEWLASALGG